MLTFIIWTLFIFISEIIFKILVFNNIFNGGVIYTIIFYILLGALLTIITRLFKEKANKIISYIILTITSFFFGAQYIYFMIYSSPFSLYSLTQGGTNQALDSITHVIRTIGQNPLLILFFIPLLVHIVLDMLNLIDYSRLNIKKAGIFIAIIAFCIISIISIFIYDKKSNNHRYNIFTNSNNPILISNYFGINGELYWDINAIVLKTFSPNVSIIEESNSYKDITLEDYNVMEIDFDTLINNENDETIKTMHEYFKSTIPTNKNEYTGKFKGKNLILVLAESLSDLAIDPVLTPTLYKMYTEGISFNNFYTPLYPVSTIDGEYITATGLIPKAGVWSLKYAKDNYMPFTLANMLKSQYGYTTNAYHNHTSAYYSRYNSIPNLGYDTFTTCSDGLNINCNIWPESDLEMINATTSDYINLKTPFLTYYLTVSGHLTYNMENAMVSKNWDRVKNLNYSNTVKSYLACQIELDKAMNELITKLDEAGIAENTVIALSGDHYPYGLTLDEINELSTTDRDKTFDINKGAFLIWHKGIKHVQVNKLSCNLDIVPTLANMFGLKYDSRLLMGKDIFSNSEPIVILANKSWITEYGRYNSITNKFIKSTDKKLDKEYINNINSIVTNRFNMSTLILDTNYYSKVLK